MKPTPIAEVIRRIRPLSPIHKAAHLRGLIASEKKHSIRRHELELALKQIVNADLGMPRRPRKRRRVLAA